MMVMLIDTKKVFSQCSSFVLDITTSCPLSEEQTMKRGSWCQCVVPATLEFVTSRQTNQDLNGFNVKIAFGGTIHSV